MPARRTVEFLNEFFDLAVSIVNGHGGHANKFVGDGLLAVFGAPVPSANHACDAIEAACDLVEACERAFRGEHRIGIGISSGEVVSGTIGGGGKLDFTVVGDTVNVAARFEQLTKRFGDSVLLTGETAALAPPLQEALVSRGTVEVRGRARPVELFAPRNLRETAALLP